MLIKEQIDRLNSLQNLDLEILKIKSLIEWLPFELNNVNKKFENINLDIDHEKKIINLAKERIGREEQLCHDKKILLKKSEKNRENVTDSREFNFLEKEIELYNLDILVGEKRIRNDNEIIEKSNLKIENLFNKISEINDDIKIKKLVINESLIEKNKELEILLFEREQLSKSLEKNILERYEKIKKDSNNKLGAVEVYKNSCGSCNIIIPIQRIIEINLCKSIYVCENCAVYLLPSFSYDIENSFEEKIVNENNNTESDFDE
jgi:predicted  nucleic acid-binding Zn-ribbon protein